MDIDRKLRSYGYAPGDYFFRCNRCEQQKIGDKRALTCKNCALECIVNSIDKEIAQLEEYKQQIKTLKEK